MKHKLSELSKGELKLLFGDKIISTVDDCLWEIFKDIHIEKFILNITTNCCGDEINLFQSSKRPLTEEKPNNFEDFLKYLGEDDESLREIRFLLGNDVSRVSYTLSEDKTYFNILIVI